MDDANVPSLLALPILGFVDKKNDVYQNTRKMLLEKAGNPYYLEGKAFHGIGGMPIFNSQYPHSGQLLTVYRTTHRPRIRMANELAIASYDVG